jgi:diaminopimelate epimerase
MSGTGNDFIIIDHRRQFLGGIDLPAFARAVCRRKFSVGADGLILIEKSETADFGWKFFNGDGSVAEMCGNGARCAARFAYENGIAPAAMRFDTLAGTIEASVSMTDHRTVKVRLTSPQNCVLDQQVSISGRLRNMHSINTGVPHAIFIEQDLASIPVLDWGREVRYHKQFQPAGTNVNFVKILSDGSLLVRTYERGVEGETMACGTGAVASAIVAAQLGLVTPPVQVTTSGGEHLTIYFSSPRNDTDNNQVTEVYLEGSTHLIYEGQLRDDGLLPGPTAS